MKKLVMIIIMAVTFGMPTSALTKYYSTQNSRKKEEIARSLFQVAREQAMDLQRQLHIERKIYDSITGMKKLKLDETDIPENRQEQNKLFFLENPENIYQSLHTSSSSDLSSPLKKIMQDETSSEAVNEMRAKIEHRRRYATATDKVISQESFENTESRFQHINELLKDIEKTKSLKDIAELQTHIEGELAMIQNEVAKLQAVIHLRKAERTLISQQKYRRNMRILSKANVGMPKIQ
ncbi:type IV secretion system protein [Bartonella sp. F02]|uniref:type IV secretion system protein n=1 Tax=Bartonella sp. F02 TaxID=2967262 RepID=UPI0022A9A1F7|nr:type IV secretion system protein [Bartonella sp. F02]MCZ2328765.1 conjugal transfer protein [Bartonella sp. F02]